MSEAVANPSQATPKPPHAAQLPFAAQNPGVARCCQAYDRAMKAAKAKEKSNYEAEKLAGKAYRDAMPPLCGLDNIRDFIACVAHGMLIASIAPTDAARLLYAAQIAQTAARTPPASSPAHSPAPSQPASAQPIPDL